MPRIRGVTTVELDGQYRALREEAGMLERGERRLLVACRGPDAAEYLHGQLTNDIEALEPGHGCYAALLDRKGQMQADMRVLRTPQTSCCWTREQAGRDALGVHLGMYRVGRDVDFENLADESHGSFGDRARRRHRHRRRPRSRRSTTTARLAIGGAGARAVATDVGIDLICRAGRPGGDRGGARGRAGSCGWTERPPRSCASSPAGRGSAAR